MKVKWTVSANEELKARATPARETQHSTRGLPPRRSTMKYMALILATLLSGLSAGLGLATSGVGVTSSTLGQGVLGPVDLKVKSGEWELELKTEGLSSLAVTENRVAPGGHFGWHSHPGPSLVIVKSGTSTFYRGDDPDCTPHVHPAGTAYVDPGGVTHIARNEGTQDLVLIVTRLVPAGAAPRIDQPNPGTCGF